MNDILIGIGTAYLIVTPPLVIGYIEGCPNKISKVIFWPIWVIIELILSCYEWIKETHDRFNEI